MQAVKALIAPLPKLMGSELGEYRVLSSTSSTATAPKTIIEFPPNTFNGPISSALGQALYSMSNSYSVYVEASHNLLTEDDIERASALYLLNDVNRLIEQGLLPNLGIDAQRPNFQCRAEPTLGRRGRPDVVYLVGDQPVMTLQYKATNTLRESDWINRALITDDRPAQQIIATHIRPGEQTALEHNAGVLAEQASERCNRCNLVVLFNYQNMIVLDFKPGNSSWHDADNPVNFYFSDGTKISHKELLLKVFEYGLKKIGAIRNVSRKNGLI